MEDARLQITFGNLPDPTIEAIYGNVESKYANQHFYSPKDYIELDKIGSICQLATWLRINHPELARLPLGEEIIEKQNAEQCEIQMGDLLRDVEGINLHAVLGELPYGEQFQINDKQIKIKGLPSGLIWGLIQAPKTGHVWQNLCVTKNEYDYLLGYKKGIAERDLLYQWKPLQYCKAVMLMYYLDMKMHYMTVCENGLKRTTSIRTKQNNKFAKSLIENIKKINSNPAPEGISNNPVHAICLNCDFYAKCPSINNTII